MILPRNKCAVSIPTPMTGSQQPQVDPATNNGRPIPTTVAPDHWHQWQATHRATLCFVIKDERVLLIRKKRGLGAGKINGPGGKVEPGESLEECAARETREELLIEPLGLARAGRLKFQFTDGYGIDVTVYRASDFSGTPTETDEAVPIWSDLDTIPFEEMWQDDELWFPFMLAHRPFEGRFIFDGDRMVDHVLEIAMEAGS